MLLGESPHPDDAERCPDDSEQKGEEVDDAERCPDDSEQKGEEAEDAERCPDVSDVFEDFKEMVYL